MKRYQEGGDVKKRSSDTDDLIPRSMLPERPPPRPRTKAERIPLEQIEEMMGETKEGKKLPEKKPKPEKRLRSGGYVRSADGCVKKGKTRGRIV